MVRDVSHGTALHPWVDLVYRQSVVWAKTQKVAHRIDVLSFIDHPIEGDDVGVLQVAPNADFALELLLGYRVICNRLRKSESDLEDDEPPDQKSMILRTYCF